MDPIFFDIHRLAELAKSDPEELERLRLREIDNLISQAPERIRNRLRGLQFQIDCKRRVHKNPLGACIEISRMMLDSLHDLNLAAQGELKASNRNRNTVQSSTVVAFPVMAN